MTKVRHDSQVLSAMARSEGNVSRAASELGIHRQQVYNVLYRLEKKPEGFRRS